ncbi:hypothetical protein D4R75_02265 [bacterium]|nr:MAG: hypothetical protein D4R75_02265 [bacterium]
MQESCIRTIRFAGLLLLIVVGTAFSQKASPARIPNGLCAVLSEGKIQITRCYDNACEILLSKLTR